MNKRLSHPSRRRYRAGRTPPAASSRGIVDDARLLAKVFDVAPHSAAQGRKMVALGIGFDKGVYDVGDLHTPKLAEAEDHALALARLDEEDGGR